MTPPTNLEENKKTREDRHAAWKTLRRDSRGRWVKKSGSGGESKSKSISASSAISTETDAQTVLKNIQNEFTLSCPRCAGDMVKKNIRCGPERLVAVNKCMVCNFFLPLNPTS